MIKYWLLKLSTFYHSVPWSLCPHGWLCPNGRNCDDTFAGDLLNEYDVLDWMHGQKTDESIQEVERDELLSLIDTQDFLGVVFCKCP